MIIAHAVSDSGDRRVLVLGVSRENIDRLTAGRPIHLSAETHPGIPAELAIAIVFGETEGDILRKLNPLISEKTEVIAVPRSPRETQ